MAAYSNKDLISYFKSGIELNTHDLKRLKTHYTQLTSLLEAHGDLYRLVLKDAWNELKRVEDMLTARKTT